MNIIVCVKQVPDTEKIEINPTTNTLKREGVASILNPYDGYALEAAAKIKDESSNTNIFVVSMGPPQAEAMLRECLAMAADKAFLVTDRLFGGSDTYATSYILSKAIQQIQLDEGIVFDAIFCGKQAIDGDTAQVGPELAEQMNYPQITSCLEVIEKNEEFQVLQEQMDCRKRMGVSSPCVLTFTKPDKDPRYPTFKRRLEARKAKIRHISIEDIEDMDRQKIGVKGSPTKVRRCYAISKSKKTQIIECNQLEEMAERIYSIIKPESKGGSKDG